MFELREHAIHGGEADFHFFREQLAIHIFSAQMAHAAGLKQFENSQARAGGFETDIAQAARIFCAAARGVMHLVRDAGRGGGRVGRGSGARGAGHGLVL